MGELSPDSKKILSWVAATDIKPQRLPDAIATAFRDELQNILPATMTVQTRNIGAGNIPYPTTFNLTSEHGVPVPILREIRDTLKRETVVSLDFDVGHKVELRFYCSFSRKRRYHSLSLPSKLCPNGHNRVNTDYTGGSSRAAVPSSMINRVATWLQMIYKYKKHDPTCIPKTLVCWFYMTNAKKTQGDLGDTLSAIHANTAFTRTCVRDKNEIVVYRKEEWFKVFIHETMHTFGLDFSAANETELERCATRMRTLFGGIKSEVNLYEAYTEFWAEITNILFIATAVATPTNSRRINAMVSMEAAFGQQQMHKVLHFMGIQYDELIGGGKQAMIAAAKYRENTSILAYYIIKNILLNNIAAFLGPIATRSHHTYLGYVDFSSNGMNCDAFCDFIARHYKDCVAYDEHMVNEPTMRMTAWELSNDNV